MINQPTRPILYVITLILAACSLLYGLLIAQTLSTLAANTVIWYSLTTGVYLAGMGLGALFHNKYSTLHLWTRLFKVELMLCLVGALAVPTLHFAHTLSISIELSEFQYLTNFVFFATAFVLILIVGVLTGYELPLLIDLCNAIDHHSKVTNRVLSADYMGSLLGGFIFPIFLLPGLDLTSIGLLTSSINLLIALIAMFWLHVSWKSLYIRLSISCGLTTSLVAGFLYVSEIEQYFLKKYYYFKYHPTGISQFWKPFEDESDVTRIRSPYQNIDLVHYYKGHYNEELINLYSTKFINDPDQPRNYTLYLNGDLQFTSNFEEYYHEYFAHVPISMNGKVPEKVLVMGGGDGILLRELVKYNEIKEILHVDLDSKLVNFSKSNPALRTVNENAFSDPRIKTMFGDAYHFIRHHKDNYDAIYLDFPLATDFNLARLYSREFFYFVRQRLAPDGFVTLDAPGIKNFSEMWQVYKNTIQKAGFGYFRPFMSKVEFFNQDAYDFLLQKAKESNTEFSDERARQRLARFSRNIYQGFLIAKEEQSFAPIYWNDAIELNVLTKSRLTETIHETFKIDEEIDETMVNSILRPRLPVDEVWKIRKAR